MFIAMEIVSFPEYFLPINIITHQEILQNYYCSIFTIVIFLFLFCLLLGGILIEKLSSYPVYYFLGITVWRVNIYILSKVSLSSVITILTMQAIPVLASKGPSFLSYFMPRIH